MGWSLGWDENHHRWIGYGVIAYCDEPGCSEEIDRGLSCVCGGQPYGGDRGCGLFFCGKHLHSHARLPQLCSRCGERKTAYDPKPEHPKWREHLLTDASWEQWRKENPEEVERFKIESKKESGR